MTITTLSRRSFGKLAAAFAALAPTLSFGQQQVELSVIAAPNFSPGATNPAVADAYKAAWAKFEADVRARGAASCSASRARLRSSR